MADLKISALTASTTPLAGTEVLPIVQSGTTKQVSVANLTAGRAVNASSFASTAGATFATSSGNVGIGVTPSAWGASSKALQIGAQSAIEYRSNATSITMNAYYDGAWKYIGSNAASLYYQYLNTHVWNVAASGTAGNNISWNQALTLDSSANLGLGVVPSAWFSTGYNALQVKDSSLYGSSGNFANLASNAFVNSTPAWAYITTGTATRYEQNNGAHRWYTAVSGTAGNPITFTQAVSIDTSSNLAVTGNVVISTSGKGIDFSATPGTGTSELLADYEEGDWTPVPTASSGSITSYTLGTCNYTKVGRMVTINFSVTITNAGTGAGSLDVPLPFTNGAAISNGCGRENALTGSQLQARVAAASTNMNIQTYANATAIATNAQIRATMTYFV